MNLQPENNEIAQKGGILAEPDKQRGAGADLIDKRDGWSIAGTVNVLIRRIQHMDEGLTAGDPASWCALRGEPWFKK
jgi:hypothetical protein